MATQVGSPSMNIEEGAQPGSMVPFRRATTFRTNRLQTTSATVTASQQNIEETIEGSGYVFGIDLDVRCVTAGNAAATAFQEDGPFSAIANVVFRDVNGELVNLSGFHLYLANLYGGWKRYLPSGSTDTLIYQATTGAGATGGSFRFHLFVPVGLNRRSLLGILGNQDRAQRYSLKSDLAASTAIYSTAPTAAGTVTVERAYENYAVPAAMNAAGQPQEQFPKDFGVLSYLTQSVSPSAPQGGATVNHYLARLGNTIRCLILVLRSNGSRTTAEANLPTLIQFQLGDTPLFSESPAYRRNLMRERYGFDAPAGVFVYDFITDIVGRAGDELGDDYIWTNGLVNAQFQITYPTGFGAANNSLTVITSDMQIPADVDIYS